MSSPERHPKPEPDPPPSLNLGDPYEARAYLYEDFSCRHCGAILLPKWEAHTTPDLACLDLAHRAKQAQWHLPPTTAPDGRMDLDACHCPPCAARLGLLPSRRSPPPLTPLPASPSPRVGVGA